MKKTRSVYLLTLVVVLTVASILTVHADEVELAQALPNSAPNQMNEFDFIIGNWTATSKRFLPNGTLDAQYEGAWTAQFVDEGRMVFDAVTWFAPDGKKAFYDATLRTFSPKENQWEMVWLSSYRAIHSQSFHGQFIDGEGHFDIVVSLSPEQSIIGKVRFYDIKKDSFEWLMENSTDGGESWFLGEQITAKRVR